MNTREKFRYMAFGGALVFLGMLGAMMSPLTAEKDKFGEIECTSLTVVDPKTGKSGVSLRVDEDGGFISAHGKDGKSAAALGIGEHGGHVSAFGKDGTLAAMLGVVKHGGHVHVGGKGEGLAVMGINEYGNGAVSTWDKNGYRQ